MDFIVNDYFLFIVGAIAVLMIIIGYIAEKTDFGRKPFKEKKAQNNDLIEETTENIIKTEEPVVISESEDSNNSIMESDFSFEELPKNIEEENNVVDQVEVVDENPTFEESPMVVDDVVEEPAAEFDIPEIIDDNADDTTVEAPKEVEEIVNDDSEDDVWKF